MVNEDASTNPIIRAENFKDLFELVDAFEELNDNTRFCEVITPHVLNEFGVMTSLNPDPGGPGDSGSRLRSRDRTRVGQCPPPRSGEPGGILRLFHWCGTRREGNDGAPLEPEPRTQGERTSPPPAVFEFDQVYSPGFFHADDRAHP